jgi:hypothetical protein
VSTFTDPEGMVLLAMPTKEESRSLQKLIDKAAEFVG